MKRRMWTVVLVAIGLAWSAPAAAQVFTPTYLSPQVRNDIGVYLADGPGDVAFEGIWRGGPIGIRLGYAGGVDALLLGGAYFQRLQLEDQALELLFTGSAQGLLGEVTTLGAAAGLSAGYTFVPGGVSVTPYLHPRVAVVNDRPGDPGTDFEVLAEIGAEAVFSPQWVGRLSVEFTDLGAAVGVGVAIRPPGGVEQP